LNTRRNRGRQTIQSAVARAVVQGNWDLVELREERTTLEEVFVRYTTSEAAMEAA
jgi:hypothetical protein